MTKFILLAIISVIHGGICADTSPPPYLESYREIIEVVHAIQDNVFLLDYNKIVEEASVEALSNPQKVLEQAQKVYDDLDTQTTELHKLIKSVSAIGLKDVPSDSLIDLFVKSAPEKYEKQVKLHFAAGKAAKKFNENNVLFKKASKELLAHKFVVTKFETLMDLIFAIADVSNLMYLNFQC